MPIYRSAFVTAAAYDDTTATLYGAVYDRDGSLVHASLRPDMGAWKHGDVERLDAYATAEMMGSATYAGRFHAHFGHFIVETLPSLYAAKMDPSPILCHPWPVFKPEWIASRFRGFFLDAIGVSAKRIVFADRPLIVQRLHVPPPLKNPINNEVSRELSEAYECVRQFALSEGQPLGGKLYFSRRRFTGGSNRHIANELEVENALADQGFAIIFPEELAIKEQILAVADARVVAGCDGSAMHLCGFMKPGTTTILIESRRQIAVEAINNARGITTHRLPICSTLVENNQHNVTVDVKQLRAAVRSLT